jgi:predicted DNA-binding transcriptional regulator YafY
MPRSERLLDLLQALRRHRRPVSGAALAAELSVSLRTIYRDIETLVGQGAPIEGEAGVGYVLRPGFTLPPLMFNTEEIEALTLGCRFVMVQPDPALARAARDALAKISAVLPPGQGPAVEASPLIAGPSAGVAPISLSVLRAALKTERKLRIRYRDGGGALSERTIWPIALAFFDEARVLVGWCELRGAFRHFRADRLVGLTVLDEVVPKRRRALLKAWRDSERIPDLTETGEE